MGRWLPRQLKTRQLKTRRLTDGRNRLVHDSANTDSISDGGEFVVIEQSAIVDAGKIRIDPTEWTALKTAIDRMIQECRPLQASV